MTTPTSQQITAALADKEHKKERLLELFREMTRVELLDFEDAEPKEMGFNWNTFYDAMYERGWPLKKDTLDEFLNERDLAQDSLKNQVEGMQKKIDKILKLLEKSKLKLSFSDAMKL